VQNQIDVGNGPPSTMAAFIEKGTDVNARDAEGASPLDDAAWSGAINFAGNPAGASSSPRDSDATDEQPVVPSWRGGSVDWPGISAFVRAASMRVAKST